MKTDIFEIISQQETAEKNISAEQNVSAIDFALQTLTKAKSGEKFDTYAYKKEMHDLDKDSAEYYINDTANEDSREAPLKEFLHFSNNDFENSLYANEFYSLNRDILNTIKDLLSNNYSLGEKRDIIYEIDVPVFKYTRKGRVFTLDANTTCTEVSFINRLSAARYVLNQNKTDLVKKTDDLNSLASIFYLKINVTLDLTNFPCERPKTRIEITVSTDLNNFYYAGQDLDPYIVQTETHYNFNMFTIDKHIEFANRELENILSRLNTSLTGFSRTRLSHEHLPIIFSSLEGLFFQALKIVLLKYKKGILTYDDARLFTIELKAMIFDWKEGGKSFEQLLNELELGFEIIFKELPKNIIPTLEVFCSPLIEKILSFSNHIRKNRNRVLYQENGVSVKNSLFILALGSIQTGLLNTMEDTGLQLWRSNASVEQDFNEDFAGNELYLQYLNRTDGVFSLLLEIEGFILRNNLRKLIDERKSTSTTFLSYSIRDSQVPLELEYVDPGEVRETVTCVSRQALYSTLLESNPGLLGLIGGFSAYYTARPIAKLFYYSSASPYLLITQPVFAAIGFYEGIYATRHPRQTLPKPLQFGKVISNSLTVAYFCLGLAINFYLYLFPKNTEVSDDTFLEDIVPFPAALILLYCVWNIFRKDPATKIDRVFNFLFNFILAGGNIENIATYFFKAGSTAGLLLPTSGIIPAILQETRLKETTSLLIRLLSAGMLSTAFIYDSLEGELSSNKTLADLTLAGWALALTASAIFTFRNTVHFKRKYEAPIIITRKTNVNDKSELPLVDPLVHQIENGEEETPLLVNRELITNVRDFKDLDKQSKIKTHNMLLGYRRHLERYQEMDEKPQLIAAKKRSCCCTII